MVRKVRSGKSGESSEVMKRMPSCPPNLLPSKPFAVLTFQPFKPGYLPALQTSQPPNLPTSCLAKTFIRNKSQLHVYHSSLTKMYRRIMIPSFPHSPSRMKKLLLAIGTLVSLVAFVPLTSAMGPGYVRRASVPNYSYDCVCLFSDPSGTCQEYTCDAWQNRQNYGYGYYYGNSSRSRGAYSRNSCGGSSTWCNANVVPVYQTQYATTGVVSPYYNNYYNANGNCSSSGLYYGSTSCDYQWSSARYTSPNTPLRRYYQPYIDAPMYYY